MKETKIGGRENGTDEHDKKLPVIRSNGSTSYAEEEVHPRECIGSAEDCRTENHDRHSREQFCTQHRTLSDEVFCDFVGC